MQFEFIILNMRCNIYVCKNIGVYKFIIYYYDMLFDYMFYTFIIPSITLNYYIISSYQTNRTSYTIYQFNWNFNTVGIYETLRNKEYWEQQVYFKSCCRLWKTINKEAWLW